MPSLDDGKIKIIRDPIHGYVEVGENLVKEIIDTPFFQRLLRIQQTNLSVLYPSATHTRFEHSLGVFFLGRFVFDTLCENTEFSDFGIEKEVFKEKYKATFLLACLLHDIGHAPLSHIGEFFFDNDELKRGLNSLGINIDSPYGRKPAAHELMSCIVALFGFSDIFKKYGVDKELFCRMITGAEYSAEVEDKDLKNILIRLLSSSFDIDKMDYIMRDSISAGVSSLTLDIYRIANSLAIFSDAGTPRLAFKKVGFSVVNSIINNRNYLYYWLYGHHKVQYHYNLLRRYIIDLKRAFPEQIRKLFSIKAITDKIEIDIPHKRTIKQVDDYDMWSIMKIAPFFKPEFQTYYEQIFERKHYYPLWKTKIEFDQVCRQSVSLQENLPTILDMADDPIHNIEPKVAKLLEQNTIGLKLGEFYIFNREYKISFPDFEEKIYFYVPGSTPPFKRYSELFSYEGTIPISEISDRMFYVFLRKDKTKEQGKALLNILQNLTPQYFGELEISGN